MLANTTLLRSTTLAELSKNHAYSSKLAAEFDADTAEIEGVQTNTVLEASSNLLLELSPFIPRHSAMEPFKPDLTHLISSNDAPSSIDVIFVRQYIQGMVAQGVELRRQLEELENRIEERKPILSPIRRLPAEILG